MIRDPDYASITGVLCDHSSHQRAFTDRMVVCFFWQMIVSYQTEFLVAGRFRVGNRGDAALMKWLYDRLSTRRRLEQNQQIARADSSEEACLELAAMAQAIKIAGAWVPAPPNEMTARPSTEQANDPLSKLRGGVNALLEQYRTSGMNPSGQLVQDFVSMMMWWETDDGLEGLQYLIVVIEGDSNDES
jgi:hypothetical protein